MPNNIGSYNDALSRGIRELTTKTPIRQMVSGGKARSILEVQAKELENASRLEELNQQKPFLPTTYGQFLQHLGTTVGLSQYGSFNAEALAEDQVVKFYTRLGGTFGSINDNADFTIPANTILTCPEEVAREASGAYIDIETPDTITNRSINYITSAPVYCSYTAKEAYASVKAMTPGSLGNLAAPGMLVKHNFASYSDHFSDSLLVINTKPILNGSDGEGEASFKYRVSKEHTAAERANDTALRMAALGVRGVADVVIVPFLDGPGRFNVFVKGISSIVSDRTILDVQKALDSVKATGCEGFARKPYEVGLELITTVSFRESLKAAIRDEILAQLESTATRYVNSLGIGAGLDIPTLARELSKIDSRVSSMGRNPTTLFDGVFVYYPARLAAGGRRREKLIQGTITVPPNGRLIMETSISDPVRFS